MHKMTWINCAASGRVICAVLSQALHEARGHIKASWKRAVHFWFAGSNPDAEGRVKPLSNNYCY